MPVSPSADAPAAQEDGSSVTVLLGVFAVAALGLVAAIAVFLVKQKR